MDNEITYLKLNASASSGDKVVRGKDVAEAITSSWALRATMPSHQLNYRQNHHPFRTRLSLPNPYSPRKSPLFLLNQHSHLTHHICSLISLSLNPQLVFFDFCPGGFWLMKRGGWLLVFISGFLQSGKILDFHIWVESLGWYDFEDEMPAYVDGNECRVRLPWVTTLTYSYHLKSGWRRPNLFFFLLFTISQSTIGQGATQEFPPSLS